MKKLIAVFTIILLLISPSFALVGANASGEVVITGGVEDSDPIVTSHNNVSGSAEIGGEDGTSTSGESSSRVEFSKFDIKFREFRDGVNDFVFSVKNRFTFSEESRVELIKERNKELQARQQAWVEMKTAALNSSTEVDAEVRASIKEKHEEIINEYARMRSKLEQMEERVQNEKIKAKIRAEINETEQSSARFGLGADVILFWDNDEYKQKPLITETEAKEKVEAMGYEVVDIELENEENIDYWNIEAKKSVSVGSTKVNQMLHVAVDARTGLILGIQIRTGGDIESEEGPRYRAEPFVFASVGSDGELVFKSNTKISGNPNKPVQSGINSNVGLGNKAQIGNDMGHKIDTSINSSVSGNGISGSIGVGL